MHRWRMRGAAALAVIALTVAACDQQPNDLQDDLLDSPGVDPLPTVPTDDTGTSPDLDASPDASPDLDTSPSPTPDS